MAVTATVRDLRHHVPKGRQPAPAVDYWARLTASQPKPISAAAVRALQAKNRGQR